MPDVVSPEKRKEIMRKVRSNKNKSTELERLAMGLLEFETLDKEEIENVVKGARITRDPKCTNTVVKSDDIRDKRRVGALAADAAT